MFLFIQSLIQPNIIRSLSVFCRLWTLATQPGQYFARLDLGTNTPPQTEKEAVCGQAQVSPSSRTMQLPSSQQQHSRRIRAFACLRCFPCRVIPFRTVIRFSRCCSPMNYLKCILFWLPVPYVHKVGNQPEISLFPRSRNCGKIKMTEQQIGGCKGALCDGKKKNCSWDYIGSIAGLCGVFDLFHSNRPIRRTWYYACPSCYRWIYCIRAGQAKRKITPYLTV